MKEKIRPRYNISIIPYFMIGEIPVFLMLKAKKDYWQFPQGGVDFGETSFDAGRREFLEETGLEFVQTYPDIVYMVFYDAKRNGNSRRVNRISTLVKINPLEELKISEEHDGCCIVSASEAFRRFGYPEQAEEFRNILRIGKDVLNYRK